MASSWVRSTGSRDFARQERRADVDPAVFVDLARIELSSICAFLPQDSARARSSRGALRSARPLRHSDDNLAFVEANVI